MGKTRRKKRDGTGPYSGSFRASAGLKGARGGVCKTKVKKRKTKKR